MINETIGWTGNILFAICGIPQVIKTYRSKSAKDLSLLFLWLWFVGELLTFIYIVVGDLETAIAEGATIVRVGTAIFGQRIYPDSYYWNESEL